MGYYLRVLAERDVETPVQELRQALLRENLNSQIVAKDGEGVNWSELSLRHADNTEIAFIERNPVLPGELGAEEVAEFLQELQAARPRSAADWLTRELRSVRAIYAFQVLEGADTNGGWDSIHVLLSEIRGRCHGFTQADGEGFSNHDGSQITWQFADSVNGEWQMAVLDSGGNWKTFRMDLGNPEHRAAFLNGKIPPGVQPIQS